MTANPHEKLRRAKSHEVDSFYHLSGCSLSGGACHGAACFVARHLDPQRRAAADQQPPRVYCLGQCFAAPAVIGLPERPRIESRSIHPIVLQRLIKGGARR